MPTEYATLLDAPLAGAKRIPIAREGQFTDRRYGEFGISETNFENWQRNLERLPGGRALVDVDHKADRPQPFRDTQAAGWVTGLEKDGDMIYGTFEPTPKGEQLVKDGRYLFTSAVFGKYKNESGETFDDTLMGVSLTNRPFIKSMPMVTLASEEHIQQAFEREPAFELYQLALDGALGEELQELALVEESDERVVLLDELKSKARGDLKDSDFALSGRRYPIHDVSHARNALARAAQNGNSEEQSKVKTAVYRKYPALKPDAGKKEMGADADSRPQMKLSADILKGLGITDEGEITKLVQLSEDEGTEVKTLLEAIEAAKPAPVEPKTLDQLAEEKGVIVLSKEDHEALEAKAATAPEPEPQKTLEERAEEAGLTVVDPETLTALEADHTKVVALEAAVDHLREAHEESQKQLATQTFDSQFEKSLDEGRVVPEQRERYEHFYSLDQEGTLKMLSESPPIVNVAPKGRNHSPRSDEVPAGFDADRMELDSQVQAYMGEHEVDYLTALDKVTGLQIAGMS